MPCKSCGWDSFQLGPIKTCVVRHLTSVASSTEAQSNSNKVILKNSRDTLPPPHLLILTTGAMGGDPQTARDVRLGENYLT
jgi:hypothetical protein